MSEFISKINDNGKDYIIRDAAAAPIESPNLRGVPTAPTAAQETKNDQIATTAFVHGLVNNNIDSKLGNPGGIATLDENGNIPSSQLPSYVDDVLDGTYDKENDKFLKLNGEIYSPESSKIYIDVNTRVTYRWTGTTYAEIASSLALGTTAATAFPGNRGLALEQEVAALSQGTVTYRGTIGTDGDITELPTTYKRGDMYRVITEGTYSEQECEVGDFLFCTRDNILTVAALPSYDKNRFKRYIIYQKYNPQTGANGEIIFAAMAISSSGSSILNRVYYDIQDEVKQLYLSDMFYIRFYNTTNNGVTWTKITDGTYGEPYVVLFTETETEAIRILNSNVEIYNNENAIIYSPNPWGLSGYATDWAVIQGNLEDTIGEGAIYIDPDETSSEVENVDAVTSAKLVSYNNSNTDLTSTNVQGAVDEISNKIAPMTTGVDITGMDLDSLRELATTSFVGYGKINRIRLNGHLITDESSGFDCILENICIDDKIVQYLTVLNLTPALYHRTFLTSDAMSEFAFVPPFSSAGVEHDTYDNFFVYTSDEAGTQFELPFNAGGIFSFTIIEKVSAAEQSNPSTGTACISYDYNLGRWVPTVSFNKSTDSAITGVSMTNTNLSITLSSNRYVTVHVVSCQCAHQLELTKIQ